MTTPDRFQKLFETTQRKNDLQSAFTRMERGVGEFYRECSLDNFQFHGTAEQQTDQRMAIAKLREFCANITANIIAGRRVVLFGPPGTGKDHLLTALIREAFMAKILVEWADGLGLFSRVRDGIGQDLRESEVIRSLIQADVLAISDPLPPWGSLTQFQASVLFQIIDRRYRDRRPTWVTANFHDGKEAGDRLGVQVMDRLKDGALVVSCDWNSFRKAGE